MQNILIGNVNISDNYLHLYLENPVQIPIYPYKLNLVCTVWMIMLLTDSLLANTHGVLFQFLLKAAQFPSNEMV